VFEGQQAPSALELDRPGEQAQVVTVLPIVHEETNTILEREETSTSISKKEKIVLIQEPVAPKGNSTKRFWIRAAAAAVVLPFLFYSFWVPLKTEVLETKTLAFIDFNPFYQIEKPLYQANKLEDIKSENNHIIDIDNIINSLPEEAQVFNFNYDAELIIPVQYKNITLIPSEINTNKPLAKDNEPAKKIENDILANNNSFHIISGCFSEKSNADRHLKDLRSKGFDAYQVDVKGGLHRIAVGGSSNQQEAILLSQELKDQGLSVWTLRK
jgi:cell division septation protein DedD